MTSFFNHFKSLALIVIVLSFFMGATLISCTGNKKTENTEATSESDEHPAGEEHPSGDSGDEHPSSNEEHPSDTTKTE